MLKPTYQSRSSHIGSSSLSEASISHFAEWLNGSIQPYGGVVSGATSLSSVLLFSYTGISIVMDGATSLSYHFPPRL